MMFKLACIGCKSEYSLDEIIYYCKKCNDLLEVQMDLEEIKNKIDKRDLVSKPLSVWKYIDLIPIFDKNKIVTIKEGGTKLHKCENLAEEFGVKKLYVKNEGENPTGSFKDRGMTVGVTKAREFNVKEVACASTGNTAASLSAYASKAGLKCIILIPHGAIAIGKLAQSIVYGAKVIAIKGNFDEALSMVIEASKSLGLYLLNSINPFRIEGQKTAAFEVCEQLNFHAPDRLIIPVGNAANISAYWKGFKEFYQLDFIKNLPKMIGIQASGASPIVQAIKEGRDRIKPVKNPSTVATAIRIGKPASWKKAIIAIRESKGMAETVTDEEILSAQRLLARKEGLFVEPASASSIAGLKRLIESGSIDRDEEIVCIATGHGLKDPDSAIKFYQEPTVIEPEFKMLKEVIKG
ncbi:MAG: threonine synthase [archaeon]|nr:threonine synthase [archaeon]MCP8314345.1 threonine synthase [archaeon]